MADKHSRVTGFADMFPPDSDAFTRMENLARELFSRCGFVELRTPILEHTDLFKRSVGEETDVVQKEMFTFPDRNDRLLTLRPEATAGVMRAYVSASLHARESVSRLFTVGPMFRYERPQKGRMRQFHQINCECLGSESPYADADLIVMLMGYIRALGISNVTLKLNSLGCAECRPRFREALTAHLRDAARAGELCGDCSRRLETNPLRVLDCKQPGCRERGAGAPRLLDFNCPACKAHFDDVLNLLRAQGQAFEIDHRLVRGLDYYCRTTFEVASGDIGAQAAMAGGGRYDGLVRNLGGPDVPGVGFAMGMERAALLLPPAERRRADFYLVAPAMGDDQTCRQQGFALVQDLRAAGLCGEMCLSAASFKSQMRQADKSGARFCLVLGPDEVIAAGVRIKDMDTGEQRLVPMAGAAAFMKGE